MYYNNKDMFKHLDGKIGSKCSDAKMRKIIEEYTVKNIIPGMIDECLRDFKAYLKNTHVLKNGVRISGLSINGSKEMDEHLNEFFDTCAPSIRELMTDPGLMIEEHDVNYLEGFPKETLHASFDIDADIRCTFDGDIYIIDEDFMTDEIVDHLMEMIGETVIYTDDNGKKWVVQCFYS